MKGRDGGGGGGGGGGVSEVGQNINFATGKVPQPATGRC